MNNLRETLKKIVAACDGADTGGLDKMVYVYNIALAALDEPPKGNISTLLATDLVKELRSDAEKLFKNSESVNMICVSQIIEQLTYLADRVEQIAKVIRMEFGCDNSNDNVKSKHNSNS